MIPFIRGYIAGLRDTSLWFCPYWVNIDDDESCSPTDTRAIQWHNGWSRGRWGRIGIWINGDQRNEPFDTEEPF